MSIESNPPIKTFDKVSQEVDELKKTAEKIKANLNKLDKKYLLAAGQIEWHLIGLIYHYERLTGLYERVSKEVAERAIHTKADVLVMHSKEMQQLIFEFYSLVNLARISLDQFLKFLRPCFKNQNSVPKSINDFLGGYSKAPYYQLSQIGLLPYLVDIRNCIVHYRSFSSTDNTIAISEGFKGEEILGRMDEHMPRPVIRTSYRRHEGNPQGISVNILLPDVIFEKDERGKKVRLAREFSYNDSHNIPRVSTEIVKLIMMAGNIAEDMLSKDEIAYEWNKSAKS